MMQNIMQKKLLIGSVALFIAALLNPLEFDEWIVDTLFGISISALFLTPLASMITGERRKVLPITLGLGFVLFLIYMQYYLNGDVIAAITFIAQWIATFAFISVIFQLVFSEFREKIGKLFG